MIAPTLTVGTELTTLRERVAQITAAVDLNDADGALAAAMHAETDLERLIESVRLYRWRTRGRA